MKDGEGSPAITRKGEPAMTATEFFTKSDLKALNEKLDTANGRATARTLSADKCAEYLEEFERKAFISKKAMTGTTVTVHASMEKLPLSYKYSADSTKAVFEYDGKHWRFKNAERSRLVQRAGFWHVEAVFSQTAILAIADRYAMA